MAFFVAELTFCSQAFFLLDFKKVSQSRCDEQNASSPGKHKLWVDWEKFNLGKCWWVSVPQPIGCMRNSIGWSFGEKLRWNHSVVVSYGFVWSHMSSHVIKPPLFIHVFHRLIYCLKGFPCANRNALHNAAISWGQLQPVIIYFHRFTTAGAVTF